MIFRTKHPAKLEETLGIAVNAGVLPQDILDRLDTGAGTDMSVALNLGKDCCLNVSDGARPAWFGFNIRSPASLCRLGIVTRNSRYPKTVSAYPSLRPNYIVQDDGMCRREEAQLLRRE